LRRCAATAGGLPAIGDLLLSVAAGTVGECR
jgi:hypothetical protein